MPNTSPLPWRGIDHIVVDANNSHVATVGYTLKFEPEQLANTELIVRAVNSHAALLSALRDALDSLEYVEANLPGLSGYGVRQQRIREAQAAINLAEGKNA